MRHVLCFPQHHELTNIQSRVSCDVESHVLPATLPYIVVVDLDRQRDVPGICGLKRMLIARGATLPEMLEPS